MEIFFYLFAFGGFAGVALYAIFLGALWLIDRDREQKKDIANLEEDNLTLARRNQALRELLQKQTEQLLQK